MYPEGHIIKEQDASAHTIRHKLMLSDKSMPPTLPLFLPIKLDHTVKITKLSSEFARPFQQPVSKLTSIEFTGSLKNVSVLICCKNSHGKITLELKQHCHRLSSKTTFYTHLQTSQQACNSVERSCSA